MRNVEVPLQEVISMLSGAAEFQRMYERHVAGVQAAAFRVLHDAQRAEDVAHEVFIEVWRNPGRFDPSRGGLGPYLRLMARSRALDLWRSEDSAKRATERLREVTQHDTPPPPDDPETVAMRRADREDLVAALRGLPQAQREALVLRYWAGLSAREIAGQLRIPFGTARGRIRLGLEKLATAVAARPAA
jgi:RNA polymerase sigma-70 factor, ECF subfamily